MAKDYRRPGEALFDSGFFCPTPTDVRIGFFGVSVESDTWP